jgi:transposase
MGRPPVLPVEEKLRIVLAVLAAKTTIVQAAQDHQVSETSVCNWKRQFLDAGWAGLADGNAQRSPTREAQLRTEVDALKIALREVTVQITAWKSSAESRLGPSRTSR